MTKRKTDTVSTILWATGLVIKGTIKGVKKGNKIRKAISKAKVKGITKTRSKKK
jgi:hypothetical protein